MPEDSKLSHKEFLSLLGCTVRRNHFTSTVETWYGFLPNWQFSQVSGLTEDEAWAKLWVIWKKHNE